MSPGLEYDTLRTIWADAPGNYNFNFIYEIDGWTSASSRVTLNVLGDPTIASASATINPGESWTFDPVVTSFQGYILNAVSAPSHGSLSIHGSTVTYTPNPDFSGEDVFYLNGVKPGEDPTSNVKFTVNVREPLQLVDHDFSGAKVGTPISHSFQVTGAKGSLSFGIKDGFHPVGTTLLMSGELGGIPTRSGTYTFTVRVRDAATLQEATKSYTIVVSPPDFNFSPAANSTLTAVIDQPFSQEISATVSSGAPVSQISQLDAVPPGLTFSSGPTGLISGAPVLQGDYYVEFEVLDISGNTSRVGYTISVITPRLDVQAPSIDHGKVGQPFGPYPLVASGGDGNYTFEVVDGSLPAGLTLTSAGVMEGTPTAADTSTVTIEATDGSATTGTVTVTIVVDAEDVVFTFNYPAGALPSATRTKPYDITISAATQFGDATLSMESGSLPEFMSFDNGRLYGHPLETGDFSITVRATEGSNTTTAVYTFTILPLGVPVVASDTVTTQKGVPVSIVPVITGGEHEYIVVSVDPLHGSIDSDANGYVYYPNAGFVGTDTFTVQAYNDDGASAPAVFTVIVEGEPDPALEIGTASLPDGTVGEEYSASITAINGNGPYVFNVTSGALPEGLSLSNAGVLSGTPTSDGTFNFRVEVTDSNAGSAAKDFAITIAPNDDDDDDDNEEEVSFTFSPASGALPAAMAGEPYEQGVSASDGVAPLTYNIKSGSLPDGMILNITTGVITGPADLESKGDYAFSIEVRDANGATGAASYTLKVIEPEVQVRDRVVNVPEGQQPPNIDLTEGATGGPFTAAAVVAVEPAHGGTAEIVGDQYAAAGPVSPTGFYLKFTPNPQYSGSVKVTYSLISAHAGSSEGVITYKLVADTSKVVEDIDRMVRGFVGTRMSLLSSTIKVPGLMERRQLAHSTSAVTTAFSPSADGLTMGLSTSLIQVEAAEADGRLANERPFNVWLDTTFLVHNREENGNKWGNFGMASVGADYLVTPQFLVGISAHFDRMTDPTDEDAEITGNGWMAGPYASVELGRGVFWDTSLLIGGSSNDIDTLLWDGSFDTRRLMFDTSIKGKWDIGNGIVLTPAVRAVYFKEKVKDYEVTDGTNTIGIGGHTQEQLRVRAGVDIEKTFKLSNGKDLKARAGITAGFSGMDGNGAFAQAKAGVSYEFGDGLFLDGDLLYNYGSGGEQSAGAKVGLRFAW